MYNNNFNFRKGDLSDIKQIKDLTWLAYSQFKNILPEEDVPSWRNQLTNEKTYSDIFKVATNYLCEYQNKVVGSAFLIPKGNAYKWFDAECCYIRLLAVHPNYEGNGVGSILTKMCMAHAKDSGEKVIALHTSEFQNAARHIYENLGFGKQSEFLQFGKKFWLYKLQLDINE